MIKVQAQKFRTFVTQIECLAPDLPHRGMDDAVAALAALVASDDWLPACFRQPGESRYQQYLLALGEDKAFSIVSFVWGPGQQTPVHDHGVWGIVGILSGAEHEQRYELRDGRPHAMGEPARMVPGMVSAILPDADIHRVSNASADGVSISIHVYGGDIGTIERHAFDEAGEIHSFVSGYSETKTR